MAELPHTKMYYCVLDFEANCSGPNRRDHEIIEFPAILIDATTGVVLAEFRRFVKTVKTGPVSKFIRELTHITDEDLNGDDSSTWEDVLLLFETWCCQHNVNSNTTMMVTCGDWDLKTMLPRQLMITGTSLSVRLECLFGCWNNIKSAYQRCFKTKHKRGMAVMLEQLGIPLEGHHHSGIDDCRNIAKICHYLSARKNWDITIPNSMLQEPYVYKIYTAYRRTKRGKIVCNIRQNME